MSEFTEIMLIHLLTHSVDILQVYVVIVYRKIEKKGNGYMNLPRFVLIVMGLFKA